MFPVDRRTRVAYSNMHLLSHSSGGQKFEVSIAGPRQVNRASLPPSRGFKGESAPGLCQLRGLPAFLGLSLQPLPQSTHCLLCVCVLNRPCLSLRRIYVTTFRVRLCDPGKLPHLEMLNLIISAQTLFPSKGVFTGSRDEDLIALWGHCPVYYITVIHVPVT